MAENGVETPAQEELDVDQLLEQVKSPADERPMTGGDLPPEATAAPKVENPWWSTVEFEWNGKKIKPDSEDKARTWMSQGYNYAQRAGELNKLQQKWEQERKELLGYKDKYSSYSQVDEYAAKNPDWWKHVQESYQKREIPHNLPPEIQQAIAPIQEKLSKFEQLAQAIEQQKAEAEKAREQEEIQKSNEALESEIESIRKQYPNIDLSAKDEATGETLERRVLKHALEIQTTSFRAAFRDYLHDQLVTHAQANGKEALVKDQQAKAKKGLLGTTPAPVKELKPAPKGVRWNDPSMSGAAILKEMGMG